MTENIRRASFKIVIRKVERPFSRDPFAEIDWIFQSFGFFDRAGSSSGTGTGNSSGNQRSGNNASNPNFRPNGSKANEKESSPTLIFKEILRSVDKPQALTSTALANRLEMSRGALLNHLNTLQRSGLVVRQGRYYLPRSKSIERTIEEIHEDIERIFYKMKKTAQEIDKEMGMIDQQ